MGKSLPVSQLRWKHQEPAGRPERPLAPSVEFGLRPVQHRRGRSKCATDHRQIEPGRHHPGERWRVRRTGTELLMKMEFTLLRTRVARRMLLLFLLCAVVPIVTLASITYPIVVARLEAGRIEQLHDDGKGAGMLILARLETLAGMLQRASPAEVNADSADDGNPFTEIATEQADGRVSVERGQVGLLPVLTSAEVARLSAGKPVLVVSRSDRAPGVYLVVRSLAGSGAYPRRWGHFTVGSAIRGLELVRDGIDRKS